MEQFKQQSYDWQKEKAALARTLAFLPFLTIMALRLIVPFVMEGLGQLQNYKDSFLLY